MSNFASAPPARLLIVEDDDRIRGQLAEGLALDGHHVSTAEDAAAARRRLARLPLDIVLLDANLPDGSGYGLLREIRKGSIDGAPQSLSTIPVMIVSGRTEEVDRIRGFELGCDDYIAKPYSFGELRGRLGAVLRRAGGAEEEGRIEAGTLTIDRRSRDVWVEGRAVRLTHKEYALLVALAEDPRRVFTRDELLSRVWGFRSSGSTRTLDAHACRLRAKLAGGRERFVINTWGVGYRLSDGGERRS